MMVRSSRTKKKTVTLDLSGYDPDGADFDGGGGGFNIPPGIYPLKCESVEKKISKNDNEQLEWIFVGTSGKAKGKKFYLYTVLSQPQKLGRTISALGVEVEPGEIEFDIDEVEGAECFGEIITDEYNGEKRSKLARVMASDEEGEEPEEEEEKPRGRSRRSTNGKAAKTAVKLSEDEVKEMGEDELEELAEKHELEVDLSKFKTLTRKVNAMIEALTEKSLIA